MLKAGRVCNVCTTELADGNWYKSLQRACTYLCNTCNANRSRQWAANNPAKLKETHRKTKLKTKYGISIEEYETMHIKQNGRCFLCESESERRPLNVDHCHKTGKVRKLLCDKCNLALGLVGDSVELLENFIRYLK
jgi:hypothetical protein